MPALFSLALRTRVAAAAFVTASAGTALYLNQQQQPSMTAAKAQKDASAEEKRLAFRKKWEATVKQMQTDVCTAIEKVDGEAKFKLDEWTRAEGGGGWTKVLADGKGKC